MNELVRFENVCKTYGEEEALIYALKNVDFTLYEGEFVVILGASGAGKSTLLNLLGGMDQVSEGNIYIKGIDITKKDDNELSEYRGNEIGFVFQFYNLLPTLTVYENVALISILKKDTLNVDEVLDKVGLLAHKNKFPSQLSGGEQQRVSIARAICKNPSLLLCDEPTGALDSKTGVMVLKLLKHMCKEYGHTTIIVTHNASFAQCADKVIKMKNAKIEEVLIQENPADIDEVDY